jgi:hypothetical protein
LTTDRDPVYSLNIERGSHLATDTQPTRRVFRTEIEDWVRELALGRGRTGYFAGPASGNWTRVERVRDIEAAVTAVLQLGARSVQVVTRGTHIFEGTKHGRIYGSELVVTRWDREWATVARDGREAIRARPVEDGADTGYFVIRWSFE